MSATPRAGGENSSDDDGDSAVAAFFAGQSMARTVFECVRAVLEAAGGCEVRVSKSQVAFRRRRGFAYLWLPAQYLARPSADVVLSIALGRRDPSPRWKEVVHPAAAHWMHHLEVTTPGDIDDEVAGWLREAAARAGGPRPPPGPQLRRTATFSAPEATGSANRS